MGKKMGKVLGIMLAVAMIISAMPSMVSRAETTSLSRTSGEQATGSSDVTYVGDVDDDGTVTPKDVTKLRRFLAGGWGVNVEVADGDVDGDGSITPKDVTKLRRYLAGGWGVELPMKIASSEEPTEGPVVTPTETPSENIETNEITDTPIPSQEISATDMPTATSTPTLAALYVVEKSLDEVVVEFNSVVSELVPQDFKAYSYVTLQNGEKVSVDFSEVSKVTIAEKTVNVKFYSDFVPGTEYYVDFKGKNIGSFKAVTVNDDSVKTIVIVSEQEFDKGCPQILRYAMLDENGIDITNAKVLWTGEKGITAELIGKDKDDTSTVSCSGKDITLKLDREGKYQIRLTYSWTADNGIKHMVMSEGAVNSQALPWERGVVTGVVRKSLDQSYIKSQRTLNDKATTQIWAMGDNEILGKSIAYLQIAVPYTKKNSTIYEGFGLVWDYAVINDTEIEGPKEFTNYTVKSANDEVVMVDGNSGSIYEVDYNGNVCVKLIANKAGSTNLIIYGVSNENNKIAETVIGVVPVEVKEKRKPTVFKVEAKGDKINLSYDPDRIDFDIVLLDQYDEEIVGVPVNITTIETGDNYNGPVVNDCACTGSGNGAWWYPVDWMLCPNMITGTGKLRLQFECAGMKYSTPTISVGNGTERARNILAVSGTSLDTAVDRWNTVGSIIVSLEGVTKEGYYTYGSDLYFDDWLPTEVKRRLEAEIKSGNNYSGYRYCFYNVYKDGKLVTYESMLKDYRDHKSNLFLTFGANAWNGINVFEGITTSEAAYDADYTGITVASGSAIIKKMDAGDYKVSAYEILVDSDNSVKITELGEAAFTVKDSQAQLDITKNDNAEKLLAIDDASVDSAFTVKFKGDLVKDIYGSWLYYDYTTDGNGTAYVKSVTAYINSWKGVLVLKSEIGTKVKVAQ